ncbi:type VI immunity family protein [Massilia sp. Root335]|uniref:type VI immunity family protein n=1 Tax=Massilia sp. Root335 TaxID=1736517 RepID=UPI0006FFA1C6|nr:type VI immunity family protein [Massilia sp. Root335]KQV41127.1 hypothetical protein ASC93_18265 [Massilia sp. Root335]
MTDLPFDPLELMRTHPEALNVPGGMLTTHGPQDYIGCVPAIAGTLFFADAHLPAVRETISACFDEYQRVVRPALTWLFREEPPEGPSKQAVSRAKPLMAMLARMDEDDLVSFHYTSGKQAHDAGPWEFQVSGVQAWRVKMGGWGLCALRFSVPLLFVEQHSGAFVQLFIDCARRLRAAHGYAGHSLVLSALRFLENQAFEAFLATKLRGFEAGNLVAGAANAHMGIKTVSWLTAINRDYLEKIGGEPVVRSELPMDWFRLFDYEAGVVIQAGPRPEAAPVDEPLPARLVLPDMLLRPVRMPTVHLQYASAGSEPRLIGEAAAQWLTRLDVPPDQLMAYKAKLLDEPKLDSR